MQFWSDEDGVHRSYPLREGSLVIGRHLACDITLNGRNVSKKHIECFVRGDVVSIRDLGSSNGTFVNGNPVTSCVLKDGDKVLLGGYQLVFDLELPPPEAAGGAPMDVRPAAQDEPGFAPPPPLDSQVVEPSFAGEPNEDDTPADGSFVPQSYAPQSLQPQVVARDGHMYLRDPRSNREVEIVPRGAAPSADLSGYYAERDTVEKKKNVYLIGAAVAVGLLMIVSLVMTSGPPEDPGDKRENLFSREKYNEIVERSIDQMALGQFKEAVAQLGIAHKGRSSYGTAGLLRGIAQQWEKSGKGIDDFNWLSVEASLRELSENRWATAKVRSFASKRIDWIYDVQHHETIVAKALGFRAAGDPEKALAEFKKLPKDSVVYRKREPEIAATITACCERRLGLGKAALDRGAWSEAVDEYSTARMYASDIHQAAIAKGLRVAKKRRAEQRLLNGANIRYREVETASLEAALRSLDGVEDDGPLGPAKTELMRRIKIKMARLAMDEKARSAVAHYEAGRGVEAIGIITDYRLTGLYGVRAKIERIMRLLKEGQTAHDAKDYDLAKAKWQEAALVESSPKNVYRQSALDKLNVLLAPERSKDVALEYRAMGDVALRKKNDPVTARKLYLRAMDWDPLAVIGKTRLAGMRHVAEVNYSKARNLRWEGKTKEAIALFEEVRRYVEEGSKFYDMATRQLDELRAELSREPRRIDP